MFGSLKGSALPNGDGRKRQNTIGTVTDARRSNSAVRGGNDIVKWNNTDFKKKGSKPRKHPAAPRLSNTKVVKPSARGRSTSSSKPATARGRSTSGSRPATARGRSNSSSRPTGRERSASSSRPGTTANRARQGTRGKSPAATTRGRSTSTTPARGRTPPAVNRGRERTRINFSPVPSRTPVGRSRSRSTSLPASNRTRSRSLTSGTRTGKAKRSDSCGTTGRKLQNYAPQGGPNPVRSKSKQQKKKKTGGKIMEEEMSKLAGQLKAIEDENLKLRFALEKEVEEREREAEERALEAEIARAVSEETRAVSEETNLSMSSQSSYTKYALRETSRSGDSSNASVESSTPSAVMTKPAVSSQGPGQRMTVETSKSVFAPASSSGKHRLPLHQHAPNMSFDCESVDYSPKHLPSIAITAATPPLRKGVEAGPDLFYASITQQQSSYDSVGCNSITATARRRPSVTVAVAVHEPNPF